MEILALVGFLLSVLYWNVILPFLILGVVAASSEGGIIGFLFGSVMGGLIFLASIFIMGIIYASLGIPITEWSFGWPGYVMSTL